MHEYWVHFSLSFSLSLWLFVVLNRKLERDQQSRNRKSIILSTLTALFVIRYFFFDFGTLKNIWSGTRVCLTSIHFQEQMYLSVWNSFECVWLHVCVLSTEAIIKSGDIYTMKETPSKTAHFEWVKITNEKYLVSVNAKSNTSNTTANKKWFLHKNVRLEKSVHHQFHDNQFMCVYTSIFRREREREQEKWLLKCACVCAPTSDPMHQQIGSRA